MAERAADGAAVARLPVSDLQQRLVHDRPARAHRIGEFEIALARHGADLERAVGFADVGQALHAVEIDDVIGLHEAEVEHRHQRLAAREQLGVLETAEQPDGLVDRFRIVIAERAVASSWCRIEPSCRFFTYTNDCASIQKKRNFPNMGQSAVIVLCFDAHRVRGEER